MAANIDATIKNNDTNKTYLIRGLTPLKRKKIQPPISFGLVNTTPANTLHFRFMGQQEEFTFTFKIFNDGTDTANSTHTSAVTTVDEQIDYLMDTIFTDNFDVDWTFTQARHASPGVNVVIVSLDIDSQGGETGIATATMTIRRGRIGAS